MRYILLFMTMLLSTLSFGQTKVSSAEQKEMIAQVEAAAATIYSLQCDFSQEKSIALLKNKMISKGTMAFKKPGSLRWEYTTPYTYTLVLNGGKVMLKSSKQKNVIDVKSSQLFQEITRIMMNSVTGKCLSDNESFKITCYKSGTEWQARLVPQKKRMKQMFAEIILHFNPQQKIVKMVEMKEKTGDTTIIRLTNINKNAKLNEKIFSIN